MASHIVVRNPPRADLQIVSALGGLGVATIHEAMGRKGLLDPGIRPIQLDRSVAGSAVTVTSHPGDNLMLHAAVEQCSPGDLVVVATTSHSTDGMFGALLATSMLSRGVRGLVTDAGVRDTAELRRMGFPVWTRSISAQGTVKSSPGSVNVPVVVGGHIVRPGDVVVADDDGVVVVPLGDAESTLDLARQRAQDELVKQEQFASGVLGLDMYELRLLLDEIGVRYVDYYVQPRPAERLL